MDSLGQINTKYNNLDINQTVTNSHLQKNKTLVEKDTTIEKSDFNKEKPDADNIPDNIKKVGIASKSVEIFKPENSVTFDMTKKKALINSNIEDIGDSIKNKAESTLKTVSTATVEKTTDAETLGKELSQLTNQYGELAYLSEKLDKIQLGSDKINLDDFRTLSHTYESIMKKVDSGELKVPNEIKNKLKDLSSLVSKVETSFNKHVANMNDFNYETKQLSYSTNNTIKKLDELKKNGMSDNISNAMSDVLRNFDEVLKSGDKEKIALYNLYMRSLEHTLSKDLSDIPPNKRNQYVLDSLKSAEADYNRMATILNDAKTGHLSNIPKGKAELLSTLSKFKNVFEVDFKQTRNILSNYFDNNSSNKPEIGSLNNAPNLQRVATQIEVKNNLALATLSGIPVAEGGGSGGGGGGGSSYVGLKMSSAFGGGNITERDVDKFRENNQKFHITSEIKDINTQATTVINLANKVDESEKELKSALVEVNDFLKENKEIVDIFKNEIEVEENEVLEIIKRDTELINSYGHDDKADKEVEKIISEAEKLEQNMNLNVDPASGSIVNLLVKFREIIADLDVEMNKLVAKKMTSKIIDDSFAKYIDDNKLKLKHLDAAKKEINNILNSSKEVKESSLPYEIKQLAKDDALKKIALVALYYHS